MFAVDTNGENKRCKDRKKIKRVWNGRILVVEGFEEK